MSSLKSTMIVACTVSLLGLGTAFAQTDPAAAPAAGSTMAAPAGDAAAMPAKPMKMKKKMMKHHASKKMMKKSM